MLFETLEPIVNGTVLAQFTFLLVVARAGNGKAKLAHEKGKL
jgi:hypothetical protein